MSRRLTYWTLAGLVSLAMWAALFAVGVAVARWLG